MRTDEDVRDTIGRYADMVHRIGVMYLHNTADAEDVFQNVFLKYALCLRAFRDEEHKKAWLIRVAVNICRSKLRGPWKKKVDLTETAEEYLAGIPEEHREVLDAVRALDPKYRDVIYLHYFEGYKAREIGRILGRRENTVYSLLARGRARLKEVLTDDEDF